MKKQENSQPKYVDDLEKVLQQINSLLEQESGAQKALSEYISRKSNKRIKVGFGESTISRVAKGLNSKDDKKRLDLIKYGKEYIANFNKNKIPQQDTGKSDIALPRNENFNPKLQIILNKSFYLYFYDDNIKIKKPCIGRVNLRIGATPSDVTIENIPGSTNYKGQLNLNKNGTHLIFNMRTERTGEKALTITVDIGPENTPTIALGIYTNITSGGAVEGGSVVIEYVEKRNSMLPPEVASMHSNGIKDIQKSIREYLSDKHLNYLKVKGGINSYAKLEKFLEIQKKKKRIKRPLNFKENGIFISAPMSVYKDKPDKYKVLNEWIIATAGFLKQKCKCNVFWAGEEYDNPKFFPDPPSELDINISRLERSNRFILIYPEKTASSCLFEAGWAAARGMACTFFYKNEEDLPFMLRKMNYNSAVTHCYKDLDHLRILIEKQLEWEKLFPKI